MILKMEVSKQWYSNTSDSNKMQFQDRNSYDHRNIYECANFGLNAAWFDFAANLSLTICVSTAIISSLYVGIGNSFPVDVWNTAVSIVWEYFKRQTPTVNTVLCWVIVLLFVILMNQINTLKKHMMNHNNNRMSAIALYSNSPKLSNGNYANSFVNINTTDVNYRYNIPLNNDALFGCDDNIDANTNERGCLTRLLMYIDGWMTRTNSITSKIRPYLIILNAIATCVGAVYQYIRLRIERPKALSKFEKNHNFYPGKEAVYLISVINDYNKLKATYTLEMVFCWIGIGIAILCIIVVLYSEIMAKYKQFKCTFLPLDTDSRLMITIKFGLLIIKPYLVITTCHPQFSIAFIVLQCCSVMLISYMTYSKSHSTVLNDYQEMTAEENVNYYPQKHMYGLKKPNEFGRYYLISYLTANLANYFVLIILVVKVAYMTQSGDQWTILIYLQYIWLYFAKMYHNEIVQYFTKMKNWKRDFMNSKAKPIVNCTLQYDEPNNDVIIKADTVEYFAIQKRWNNVVYWLKLLAFTSMVGVLFCIGCLVRSTLLDTVPYLLILLVEMILSLSIFINSIYALNCF